MPRIGQALGGELWTGASSVLKFDTSDLIITAVTSAIVGIQYAYIFVSGTSAGDSKLLCYCTLTTTEIATLQINNTLTVQMNSSGVLTLT
jgi:hypothetical protein